jgi:hypothetical protein
VKSYLIDEIAASDLMRVHEFLRGKAIHSGVESLFWVKVPSSLLTPLQQEHLPCQPRVFAFETGQKFVKAELFLRTLRDMRCPCQDYCTPQQVHFVIEWVNEILKDLSIRT